jgi:carboxymethylenebutenolidase
MTKRLTSKDFDPEVLKLFDQYVHGELSRRGFLNQAGRYAAAPQRPACWPRCLVRRATGRPADPRIRRAMSSTPRRKRRWRLPVQPAGARGKLPTVLVVHENRGLNPHIEDVTRRLALDGFIAFAPDALFPLGGYPGDEDQARALFGKLDQTKTRADFVEAAGY